MSKRSAADDNTGGNGPPAKKLLTQFEPIQIGTIPSLEELDQKVLKFQNKKLAERIEQRRKAEEELRKRIEQLEQRQTTDDAVLCIVNRYWNQLDEDVRVLLQRFDAEAADECERKNESQAVTSFLTLLSQWDKQEIEDKLKQRVEFSKRSVGKLLQAYDRLLQRNERLIHAIRSTEDPEEEDSETKLALDKIEMDIKKEIKEEVKVEPQSTEESEETKKDDSGDLEPKVEVKAEGEVKSEADADTQTEESAKEASSSELVQKQARERLPEVAKQELRAIQVENKRLHNTYTAIHQRLHRMNLENAELHERLAAAETLVAELQNTVDDLKYEHDEATRMVEKYDRHLAEAQQKISSLEEGNIKVAAGSGSGTEAGVSRRKFEEIYHEWEEQRELATNRLSELEKLVKDHQSAQQRIEHLKLDLKCLPEPIVIDTTEYKCLQSQFSVLYNESMQMKQQMDELRQLLHASKTTHLRQMEQMESDELECQKKLRADVIQVEDQRTQIRREYEMLRIEFEQTLASNEQTGPINREMRHLITSLKSHNEQLKGEVNRFKRKFKEAQNEIIRLKSDRKNVAPAKPSSEKPVEKSAQSAGDTSEGEVVSDTPSTESKNTEGEAADKKTPSKSRAVEHEPRHEKRGDEAADGARLRDRSSSSGEHHRDASKERGRPDPNDVKFLRAELKKAQEGQKEMKLLLDMYKSAPKESRDKVTLLAAEKKARQESVELKEQIKKLQESERRERRKLAEDDALRKIQRLEDNLKDLHKQLQTQKQDEEALLSEMEVTGQAFEDMQEQNIRLLQQLREKDDANFKLMSERIKSNQIHKLLREEKEVLVEQCLTLQAQGDAQNVVVRKLEEKERILQNNLATVEKECSLRQQASDMNKRKAVEAAQTAADLKLHLDKYHAQLKEAQQALSDKTSNLEQEIYKYKRYQEEVAILRRKVERAKKIEAAASADEVLMAEIQEYKQQLTCPSCKVKKKDAILTKCFHVFCLECLRTRYETRQRKCPKCNATFGANDYHRIYLE